MKDTQFEIDITSQRKTEGRKEGWTDKICFLTLFQFFFNFILN